MGAAPQMRLAAPIVVCLAVLVPATAGAGLAQEGKTAKADLATTGDDSEVLRAVPIARKPGKRDRVAMRIAPSDFGPIREGDRLRVSGEVQVSTTCVENGSRCIG